MKVNQINTPQEVANVIIKSPEEANLVENFEGNKNEQKEYQKNIADIETNRMYSWSDMAKVKRDLWNKLHAVKDIMKKKAINMVQMISASMPQQVNEGF